MLEIAFHQFVYPSGHLGILAAVVLRIIRFYIENRRTIDGIQSLNFYFVILHALEFYCRYPDGIGAVF